MFYADHDFDTMFLDAVFHITAGHVGAIKSVFESLIGSDSYRNLRAAGQPFTLSTFMDNFNARSFFDCLQGSTFIRGLPKVSELQKPPIARVLRTVYATGLTPERTFTQDRPALEQCFRRGWLHSNLLPNSDLTGYLFASPLHKWFVGMYLVGLNVDIQEPDILTFVISVIRRFSPDNLMAERRFGAGYVQRPPEAQFQDEFYRCCVAHTQGGVISFSEFGTSDGRIDFFLPSKKWGVELLRNGDRLSDHIKRFLPSGAYGKWVAQSDMEDYILLDFRTSDPKFNEDRKLYSVVSLDGWRSVRILDHAGQPVLKDAIVLLKGLA